jgi:hypothetical protein
VTRAISSRTHTGAVIGREFARALRGAIGSARRGAIGSVRRGAVGSARRGAVGTALRGAIGSARRGAIGSARRGAVGSALLGLLAPLGLVGLLGLLVAGCTDDSRGPGTTSSTERFDGTLPLAPSACFSERLLDVLPSTPGEQYECSAMLDSDLLASCDANGGAEPCWAIVTISNASGDCSGPTVHGGTDGQAFSIECLVEE